MLRSSWLVMNQGILGLEQKFGDTIGNSVDLFVYCDYSVSCQLFRASDISRKKKQNLKDSRFRWVFHFFGKFR